MGMGEKVADAGGRKALEWAWWALRGGLRSLVVVELVAGDASRGWVVVTGRR